MLMTSEEKQRAEEGKRSMDELLVVPLRDGREHPISEIQGLVEAIGKPGLPYTGIAPLPVGLDKEARQKAEVRYATKRLERAGVLQEQGHGEKKTLKLARQPDWLERARPTLDSAEAEARRQLRDELGNGEWHSVDGLLVNLQDRGSGTITDIDRFVVAYGVLQQVRQDQNCETRATGQKGAHDYLEEIRLPAARQPREVDAVVADERSETLTIASPDGGSATQENPGASISGEKQGDQGAMRRPEQPGAQPQRPAVCTPAAPEGQGSSNCARQDQQATAGKPADEAEPDPVGEGGLEGAEEEVPPLRLEAGFRPHRGSAEVIHIDINLIDLDDEENPPHEVEGLPESLDSVGLLQPPAVRPSPVEGRYRIVFGRDRVRECRRHGWARIPCVVLKVDDRTAELAAIDENLVRKVLPVLERAELLYRRKQIHEELNPAAVRPRGGRPRKNSAMVAPFSTDAARKTGLSSRTVELDIEIATKLSEPAKKVLRGTEHANRTSVLSGVARLEARDQAAVAKVLAKGQAATVPAAMRIVAERRQASKGSPAAVGGADQSERGVCTAEVLVGDSLSLLPKQPTGHFRLILADPPQNDGTDYGEGSPADSLPDGDYLALVRGWLGACVPLLTDDGSLWLLTGDHYVHAVSGLLVEAGLHPRSWIKLYEPPGSGPATAFRTACLHLLHGVRNPEGFVFHPEGLEQEVALDNKATRALAALGCRWTDDVWVIPRLKQSDAERIPWFPVQRRLALLQLIIRCATDAGDWVLDPFAGSATCGVVSCQEGRHYVGIEKNASFAELARKRLAGRAGLEGAKS
jgi:DNA modification methylase